jgi:hypothetical protein
VRLGIDIGEHLAVAAAAERAQTFNDPLDIVFVRGKPCFCRGEGVIAAAHAQLCVQMIEQRSEVGQRERKLCLPRAPLGSLVFRSEPPAFPLCRSLRHVLDGNRSGC